MSRVIWHESLDSTMTEASRLAAEGVAGGTVVAALSQTAGQGRQGREWISTAGDGLYCTFILDVEDATAITLGLGVALVEVLAPITGDGLDVRWPNDVLWQGRKLCGILSRLENGLVLAGIGVNLNQLQFADGLRTPATSLRLIAGKTFDPKNVLESLRGPVVEMAAISRQDRLRLFAQTSSYVSGRRVRVDLDGPMLEGVTDGLDENGFLRIRKENGTHETVYAGSVRALD